MLQGIRSRARRLALSGALIACLAALAAATPARADAPPGGSDPAAVALAGRVMDALGGEARWNALRGLRWTFQTATGDTLRPARRHSWDKHSGWHRVEGTGRDGGAFLVIHHLESGEGRAWLGGQPAADDTIPGLIRLAKNLWINDAYWLLMPYKLMDPGVTLRMAEPVEQDGIRYERLALSFSNVGNTPGDRYWVHVDPRTHRVVRWEMVLEGREPPPREYAWEGWEEHDGLWFATAKRQGARAVFTRDIDTVRRFPKREFDEP